MGRHPTLKTRTPGTSGRRRAIAYQPVWDGTRTVGKSERDAQGRCDAILPHIPAGSTVLDFGAHRGYFAHRIADSTDARVTAVAPELIDHPKVTSIKDTLTLPQFNALGTFDVTLALSVLHHVHPWQHWLDAILSSAPVVIIETAHPGETLKSAQHGHLAEIHAAVSQLGEVIYTCPGKDARFTRETRVVR